MRFTEVTVNGENKALELYSFARFVGLEAAAHGRYSILLVIQLLRGYASRTLSPARVVDEIRALEGKRISGTKPAKPLERLPLKGLWHKHYFANGLRTMAVNLRNGIYKDGLPWLEERLQTAQDAGGECYLTEEYASAIVHDAVIGNWERRNDAAELTGEWIIFVPHQGANYYLALGDHNKAGHGHLRAQIDTICGQEFPFVGELLGAGSSR